MMTLDPISLGIRESTSHALQFNWNESAPNLSPPRHPLPKFGLYEGGCHADQEVDLLALSGGATDVNSAISVCASAQWFWEDVFVCPRANVELELQLVLLMVEFLLFIVFIYFFEDKSVCRLEPAAFYHRHTQYCTGVK